MSVRIPASDLLDAVDIAILRYCHRQSTVAHLVGYVTRHSLSASRHLVTRRCESLVDRGLLSIVMLGQRRRAYATTSAGGDACMAQLDVIIGLHRDLVSDASVA